MKRVARIFRFRRDRGQWNNPRASIGEPRGTLRNGKYQCWEAVGPARETWRVLGPEVKNFVEGSFESGPGLSFMIYMIGVEEEVAVPKILICSTDLLLRKEVRKAIKGSGIMDKYPAIGLGDITTFPDLLAQENIEPTLTSYPNFATDIAVLAPPSDSAFGRRLFVPKLEDETLRRATGGPIFHVEDNVYQLTIGHAFLNLEDPALSYPQTLASDECDFDGQSDTEDDDRSNNPGETTSTGKSADALPQTKCYTDSELSGLHNASSSALPISTLAESEAPRALESSLEKEPAIRNTSKLNIPKTLRKTERVGKLALLSETGAKPSLDYAVVELQERFRNCCNEIELGRNGSQRWLRVGTEMEIGSNDASIVTNTASSGFLRGKLRATAFYMRRPNQRTLQELYAVQLDGILLDGDCGSGVADFPAGGLYGHIVAGIVGTGTAYMVPAKEVFQDLRDRLGKVELGSPQTSQESHPEKNGRKRLFSPAPRPEPLHMIEFASNDFFSQAAKNPMQPEKGEKHSEKLRNSSPMQSFIVSQASASESTNPLLNMTGKNNSARRPRTSNPVNNFRSSLSMMRLRALPFLTTTQHKGGVSDDSNINEHSIRGSQFEGEDDNNTAVHNFELGFFALPGDLQVQIIASLDIPDILSLRTTSREWHNLISVNERPIARAFLEQDAIPQFATSLYSLPPPTEINLHYICSLRHRLLVSASLSAMMAEWITKDMFLRKTEAQWLKFLPEQARLRNRLVPLLFTAFHFFEILRNLCMEQTLERGQTLPLKGRMLQAIESKIMNTYNDETLLEVHQIFPLLISFLCSKLRPPSYLSRLERSLLGYHMVAPPDHVIAAILCVGGLREVTKFSKVQGYERRRTAVDIWYNSISSQPIKFREEMILFPLRLSRIQSREYPRQEITDSKCNTNLGTNYGSSQSTKSERVYSKKLKSNQSLLNNASLAAGPPMAFLPLECMPRLLQGLPVLQQIWVSTAESLLLERGVVERKGDIKKNAQVLRSLVDGSVTNADIRFWGDSADDVLQEK